MGSGRGGYGVGRVTWKGEYELPVLAFTSIEQGMKLANDSEANFVMLIFRNPNVPAHSVFKDLADRR
jgi:hypothetical protein